DGLAVDFVVESDRAQLSEIVQRVRNGRLRTNIGNVSTLDDAVAALNPTERRRGKTIIRVRPNWCSRRSRDPPLRSSTEDRATRLAKVHQFWVTERSALLRFGNPRGSEVVMLQPRGRARGTIAGTYRFHSGGEERFCDQWLAVWKISSSNA